MAISVDVHLLSGRRVSLETPEDATVAELNQRAQSALAVGRGRLLSADGQVLDVSRTVKRARIQNGDELYLRVQQPEVSAWRKRSGRTCAAVLGDGSVETWGCAKDHGDSSSVQAQLHGVQHIQASFSAFAAILGDGSVVTWGNRDSEGREAHPSFFLCFCCDPR